MINTLHKEARQEIIIWWVITLISIILFLLIFLFLFHVKTAIISTLVWSIFALFIPLYTSYVFISNVPKEIHINKNEIQIIAIRKKIQIPINNITKFSMIGKNHITLFYTTNKKEVYFSIRKIPEDIRNDILSLIGNRGMVRDPLFP